MFEIGSKVQLRDTDDREITERGAEKDQAARIEAFGKGPFYVTSTHNNGHFITVSHVRSGPLLAEWGFYRLEKA